MSQTPLHDRTNTFGLPTPPRPKLPALSFNSQFTATNFFSSNENTTESPTTVEHPRKRRKVASDEPFSNKSDTEVWELSDEEIIKEQFARCTSDAWKHYRITLKRHAGVIIFIFQCKHNNPKHPENTRERSKMKQGSSKLGDTAKKCEQGRAEPAAKAVAVCVLYSPFPVLCTDYFHSVQRGSPPCYLRHSLCCEQAPICIAR
ncbi:hypothetical protein FB451DRAFT_412707 [Mycena latifolia]|nr:hypothetical protein FB451DRAFT_412707 [Mycena latifolia]